MIKFKDIIFKENVAIHCPEEWMEDVLLEYADSKTNIFWRRFSYLGCWREYKKNTVYYICNGSYGSIDRARKNKYKILHYNEVAIKEEEKMETKLDYELTIKGRKAEIGSELWHKDSNGKCEKITIYNIILHDGENVLIRVENDKKTKTYTYWLYDDMFTKGIDDILFWEKPIVYQLPDTEGNLSEVKIGQEVWFMSDWCLIDDMDSESKEILLIHPSMGVKRVNNNTGKYNNIYYARTNKPHRYFSGCMDWSHAPKDAVEWRVTVDGYAFWYSNAYCERSGLDYDYDCGMYYISAGYRADLLNENGVVEDWEYSLVKRPKGK